MLYKHFLITRFNIVQPWFGNKDKNGQTVQTDGWLNRRFQLFDEFCVPSVNNQTATDFVWYVLFDSNTPEKYLDRIAEYKEMCRAFTPLFLEPNGSENKLVLDAINRAGPFEYLITTRLDNDDAIHKSFIEDVRAEFHNQVDTFICFNRGYQLDVANCCLYQISYKNNHFVSRIERMSQNIETVLCDHSKIDSFAEVIYVKNNRPNWVEVIHDGNIANHVWEGLPRLDNRSLEAFAIRFQISYFNSIIVLMRSVVRSFFRRILRIGGTGVRRREIG